MVLTKSVVVLYAQWKPITYKVRFDGNGATSGMMSDLTATYDEKKTLPANRYVKFGETFAGWNTKADGTGAAYRNKGEATNLASSQDDVVVLYAQWEDAMTTMPETGGTLTNRRLTTMLGGGLSSRPFRSYSYAAASGADPRKAGDVTC